MAENVRNPWVQVVKSRAITPCWDAPGPAWGSYELGAEWGGERTVAGRYVVAPAARLGYLCVMRSTDGCWWVPHRSGAGFSCGSDLSKVLAGAMRHGVLLADARTEAGLCPRCGRLVCLTAMMVK